MSFTAKVGFAGSIRSGENARKQSTPGRAPRASNIGARSSCVVPGYVVDSRITSCAGLKCAAASCAAAVTKEMSGSFDFRRGVGTQMITASHSARAERSVVAW